MTQPRKKIKKLKRLSSEARALKSCVFLLLLLFVFPFRSPVGYAQDSSFLEISGYLKELGQLSFDNGLNTFQYDNILHHRFETEWNFTTNFELNADLRTRLLSGYMVRNAPGLDAFYENDPDLVDMWWVWVDSDQLLLHSQIDRLHLSYYNGPLEIYAGRQRINWGKTYVWNPNDLFNNYAFLDFDYEERPGVDAVSMIYNLDFASSIETAVKLGETFEEMVIAGMYRTNWNQYDLQFIGGHYFDEIMLGTGWAGYIQDAGFKGEISYFHPEENWMDVKGFVTATTGLDYMFSNSLYVQGEVLYNGGNRGRGSPVFELLQPPSADNLFITRTGYYVNMSYPLTPLTNISGGVLGSFNRKFVILIPQISHSLTNNIDFLILAQLLKGSYLTEFIDTPNTLYFRLKWNY